MIEIVVIDPVGTSSFNLIQKKGCSLPIRLLLIVLRDKIQFIRSPTNFVENVELKIWILPIYSVPLAAILSRKKCQVCSSFLLSISNQIQDPSLLQSYPVAPPTVPYSTSITSVPGYPHWISNSPPHSIAVIPGTRTPALGGSASPPTHDLPPASPVIGDPIARRNRYLSFLILISKKKSNLLFRFHDSIPM
jgi:hypothetical protein